MPIVDYPDPYGECENALKAVLLEITDYFENEWQVSNNDTNIARGGENFIVLRPGSFPIADEFQTGQIKDYDWSVTMDLYVRYTEYEESWNQFKAVRAAMIWKLSTNPLLKCTVEPAKSAKNVWRVALASDESAQYFKFSETPDEATPSFIIQTMSVTIRQRVEFPF